MLATLMWGWCFVTLVLGELQQLREINGLFGADFPIIIGLCSPFVGFVMIYLLYANLFISLRGQEFFDLTSFLRSVGIVYVVNLLNIATAQGMSVRELIQSAESVEKAMSNMNEALCDCTVHLGLDLHISEPSPRLASLLNKNVKASHHLEGASFLGFMPYETDRARFCNAMKLSENVGTDATEPHQNTGVMNFHLSDSSGTPFEVKVAHTCVLNESGCMQYILGISAICERLRTPAIANQFVGRKNGLDMIPEGLNEEASSDDMSNISYSMCNPQSPSRKASHCSSSSGTSHCSSSSGTAPAPNYTNDKVTDAILEIKAARPYAIICASQAVEELFGTSNLIGKPFINSIVDADAFSWWLEQRVNSVNSTGCPHMEDFFGTKILREGTFQNASEKVTSVILVVHLSSSLDDPHGDVSDGTVGMVIAPWTQEMYIRTN